MLGCIDAAELGESLGRGPGKTMGQETMEEAVPVQARSCGSGLKGRFLILN